MAMPMPDEIGRVAVEAEAYLMDMDGVLVRGTQLIPGAAEFIARLRERGKPFLILTNNSLYTPTRPPGPACPQRAKRAG
jgi:NagD protein